MKYPKFLAPVLALPHGDKIVHAVAGFLLSLVISLLITPWAGFVFAIFAGVAKEVYDAQHQDENTPDPLDALATIVGGLIATLLVVVLR